MRRDRLVFKLDVVVIIDRRGRGYISLIVGKDFSSFPFLALSHKI